MWGARISTGVLRICERDKEISVCEYFLSVCLFVCVRESVCVSVYAREGVCEKDRRRQVFVLA